jgi:hypothetical protein
MADWNTQRLAQALIGPRDGKLTPENEGAFQSFMAFDPNVRQWRNGFQAKYGEQPNTNEPSFNYREAYMQGNVPQMYAGDNSMHWDSRGKAPDHPTAWMNDFMGQYGVDPVMQAQQGFTSEQQQTVNGQLSSDLLAQLLQRGR